MSWWTLGADFGKVALLTAIANTPVTGSCFWRYSQIMISAVLVLLSAAALMQSETVESQPECAGGPNQAPVVVHKADPEYSKEGRRAHIEGTVVVTAEIGTDGKAHHIHLVRRLGHGLDEEAITAVARWRFKPATTKDGTCATAPVTIEVVFRLLQKPESDGAEVPETTASKKIASEQGMVRAGGATRHGDGTPLRSLGSWLRAECEQPVVINGFVWCEKKSYGC
jgi:TonB family protein